MIRSIKTWTGYLKLTYCLLSLLSALVSADLHCVQVISMNTDIVSLFENHLSLVQTLQSEAHNSKGNELVEINSFGLNPPK